MEAVNFDEVPFEEEKKDPYAEIDSIESDPDWLKLLYKKILKMEVEDDDSGLKYWMEEIKKGMSRNDIENYFRNVALKENQKDEKVEFSQVLDEDDKGKRMLYVMPESIGDIYLSTSLFRSAKELYPDYNLYVAVKQEYFSLVFIIKGYISCNSVIPNI